MQTRKFIAVLLAVNFAGPAAALDLDMINKSKTTITKLYFSPAGDKSWGTNYLAGDPLKPGQSTGLTGIDRGAYDIKFVARDGTECVGADIRINSDQELVITEALLDGCASDDD